MEDSSDPVPVVIMTDQWHDGMGVGCCFPEYSADMSADMYI